MSQRCGKNRLSGRLSGRMMILFLEIKKVENELFADVFESVFII